MSDIATNRLFMVLLSLLFIHPMRAKDTPDTAAAGSSTIQFNAATYRVGERSSNVVVSVTRTGSTAGAASVAFATISNGASDGADFIGTNGVLNWPSGDAAGKSITIQILQDQFEEEPQDLFVTLSDATGATIGAINMAQVIIEDPAVRIEELYTSAFGAPAQIDLVASVTAFPATRVDFVQGATLIGRSSTPRADGNYQVPWTDIARGAYTVRALAFDAQGNILYSPSRTIVVSGTVAGAGSAITHVDSHNTTGAEDGSPTHPYFSIQKAVDNVAANGIVKVAPGTYRETVFVDNKVVQILGGYIGATAQDYAAGRPGDFTARDLRRRVEILPATESAVFALYNARATVVDGFVVTGGKRGFFITSDGPEFSYPKLRNNIITRNGDIYRSHGGGGVHAENSSLELINNQITFNNGGRGSGVSAGGNKASVVIRDNLIRGNTSWDDHGGGLYIIADGVISGNRIEDNEVGRGVDYGGWGGGLIVFGNSFDFFPQVALSNNVVTGNLAGNGSGEFFDEGAKATLDHELIFKNRAPQNGGGALLVDGCCNTTVTVNHCTVADNEGYRFAANGLGADSQTTVEVKNSIFWNNGSGEFGVAPDSTLRISYTLAEDEIVTGNGMIAGPGNLRSDPLFIDRAKNDYHVKSTHGRWSPSDGRRAGAWILDSVNSPAIDAADPASEFLSESLPNGGRADLGVYGNRTEANLSVQYGTNDAHLTIKGANAGPYHLESSDDFESWTDLTTLTSGTGQIEYTDTRGIWRTFYRLRQ